MKKQTKLLLGAGAVGLGLWALSRKKGDGLAGLGQNESAECPSGTVAVGQNADGSPICDCPAGTAPFTTASGETGCAKIEISPGSTYHTRDLGDPCERSSDCVGALLCRSKKCVAPKSATGTTAPSGASVPTTTDPAAGAAAAEFTGDTKAKDAEEPAVADGGMSASTWLLIIGAGAAAYFLLKTDDTKVVRLREAGSKKAAEYKRRLANGAGVNGLRRSSRARR